MPQNAIPVLPSLKNISSQAPVQVQSARSEPEKQETPVVTNLSFPTLDELKVKIQAYANLMKKQDRMLEFVMFNERACRLEDKKLVLILDSEYTKTQYETYRSGFVEYLRLQFGQSIPVDTVIEATKQDEKKLLYTPTDKFKFLAEKYPALEELKRRLGLELEF